MPLTPDPDVSDIPPDARESLFTTLTSSRAFNAGCAFGVPSEARALHLTHLLRAVWDAGWRPPPPSAPAPAPTPELP